MKRGQLEQEIATDEALGGASACDGTGSRSTCYVRGQKGVAPPALWSRRGPPQICLPQFVGDFSNDFR